MSKLQTYFFYPDSSLAYVSDEEPVCVMTCDSPCSGCNTCQEVI